MAPKQKANAEVATVPARVDEDALRQVESFDQAFALAADVWGGVVDASELLGTGFDVLNSEEKTQLLNVPFVILDTAVHDGEQGEFCSIVAVTEKGARYIINDGSTGIYQQILKLREKTEKNGGWLVRHGLRKSEYATCKECGKPHQTKEKVCGLCGSEESVRGLGRTFYLDV